MINSPQIKSKMWYMAQLLDNINEQDQHFCYCKVASSKTSHLEANAGFFRLLMKGIFDPYVLQPFDTKLIS
jgi:hypothetical protein